MSRRIDDGGRTMSTDVLARCIMPCHSVGTRYEVREMETEVEDKAMYTRSRYVKRVREEKCLTQVRYV